MYNKVFTKILDSSIWLEPMPTRIVWLTFIAAMDEDGFVAFASPANVARRANVDLVEVEKAIWVLESPDANSSDPANEGRRIERVPGGWIVLNAVKYREIVTREVARQRTRQRVAKFRAKEACNADVTPSNVSVTPSVAVADAKSVQSVASLQKKPSLEDVKFLAAKSGLPESEAARFFDYYESNGWRVGKNPMKSWRAALSNWKRNFDERRYENRSNTGSKPNPRNEGIAIGPTDYGEVAKRKMAQQALEADRRIAARDQEAGG